MTCVVTAGPTYEKLDQARRLTNFSTGRLGSELARFLEGRGHEVHLLLGHYSTWRAEADSKRTQIFTTTNDLRDRLKSFAAKEQPGAVFHAAAVSDFGFGKVWHREADGRLEEIRAGKIPTRGAPIVAELVPTPKIIAELRSWFPQAYLVGWKYEVEGDRASVIALAEKQIRDCRTDACVANGAAYGDGFGLVTGPGNFAHCEDSATLFAALAQHLDAR